MATGFRLARVLRLREQMRRLRAHEVDALTRELRTVGSERRALALARARVTEDEARAARDGTLTPDTLRVARTYECALHAEDQRWALRAVELHRRLAASREQLVLDRREERKIERLAEVHGARAREASARTQERLLDEIALVRHRRGRKGE